MMIRKYCAWIILGLTMFFCIVLPTLLQKEIDDTIKAQDIRDSFIEKIEKGQDPVAIYIWKKLSENSKRLLKQKGKKEDIKKALSFDLNSLLQDVYFYNKRRFKHVKLSKATKTLIDISPFGHQLVYFNKKLLKDAYPLSITIKEDAWISPPTLKNFMIFGTYKKDNLLYIVMNSARITLFISFFALFISCVLGIFLIFLSFYSKTSILFKMTLKKIVYFPRLFILILFASLFKFKQASQLHISIDYYLILLFGITGAVFLASQTLVIVEDLKNKLFVQFAYALQLSEYKIFFKHILINCTILPISIVKQMRDNILLLSVLTFIGVISLQPEDLGGLIYKYYSSPETFYRGWWILFFHPFFSHGLYLFLIW